MNAVPIMLAIGGLGAFAIYTATRAGASIAPTPTPDFVPSPEPLPDPPTSGPYGGTVAPQAPIWSTPGVPQGKQRFAVRSLNTSDHGLQFIRGQEKLRLSKYRDGSGYSIGYGHFIQPGETFPPTITPARAEQLFQADVAIAESALDRYVSAPLSQSEFDALVDFVFNEGAGTFARSPILTALNAGNYAAAVAAFAHYTTSQGRQVAALVSRRAAEQRMWGMA